MDGHNSTTGNGQRAVSLSTETVLHIKVVSQRKILPNPKGETMKISLLYRKLFESHVNWVEVTDNLQWKILEYSRMFYKIGPDWKPRLPEDAYELDALEFFCKRILSEIDRNKNAPRFTPEIISVSDPVNTRRKRTYVKRSR